MKRQVKAEIGQYVEFLKWEADVEKSEEVRVVAIEIDSVNTWYIARFDDGSLRHLLADEIRVEDMYRTQSVDCIPPLSFKDVYALDKQSAILRGVMINKVLITSNGTLYSCLTNKGLVIDVEESLLH